MSHTVTKIEPIIYSNANKEAEYVPLTNYSFNIPVNRSKIESIGLFFSTEGEVSGILSIDMYIEGVHRKYTVKPEQVVTDSPLVFLVDHVFHQECMIRVALNFEQTNDTGCFKIKVNSSGPCLYLEGNRTTIYEFKNYPKISIITPTYKTDLRYLKITVDSVLEQSYGNWEWCIVDDGSNDPALSDYLKSIKNDRIKLLINKKNGGIVSATNDALAMATGDYVAFLDHDDVLDTDALLYVAMELDKDPKTDLVYTDEDKVLDDGRFVGPFYKPDFNYSLFLSYMYTCHFSVYRKNIIDKIGGVRAGFDGAQDYDLALRFIEQTRAIRHVPRILYHWRITPTSTSSSIMNKPDARINGARALEGHLKRIKREGKVLAGNFPGQYNVRYTLPVNKPKVSIIIPFRDKVSLLNNLLTSFELTDYTDHEILLVDNGSVEAETKEYLSQLSTNKKIRILQYDKPFNYSKINNYAVDYCNKNSELILFLNNDVEIMHPEWLYNMVQHFVRPEVAAVGAKLLYSDHRIQHAGVVVGTNGLAAHSHKRIFDWEPGYFSRPHTTQDITCVTGACLMVRKKVFIDIKGFDPKLPEAFNDVDLCLTIRKQGWSIVYTPYARLYHMESYTRGNDAGTKKFMDAVSYMYEKWDIENFVDPYYNPNLPDNCEGGSWV